MLNQNTDWLIEFVHDYDDRYFVTKRGLDATPVVVKKFDLGVDEVMAFTCHKRANKAMTAFHFHPDFPLEDRPEYMRSHAEGHELVLSVGSRLAAQRAQKMRVFEERVSGLRRSLAVRLQTAALFLAAGGSMTR
jgi:hypothetical protein